MILINLDVSMVTGSSVRLATFPNPSKIECEEKVTDFIQTSCEGVTSGRIRTTNVSVAEGRSKSKVLENVFCETNNDR